MNKKIVKMILAAMLLLGVSGCNTTKNPDPVVDIEEPNELLAAWEAVSGTFVRDDSNQYNNGVLQMKYLSNNTALFEFRLMEGNEQEEVSDSIVLPFVLLVDEEGIGHYESTGENELNFNITFVLSEDGEHVTVSHTGDLRMSPDGIYHLIGSDLEVSDVTARAIIENLPTVLTSLNHNLGAYTIQYPEELLADWFYPVEAIFDDTGVVLARFFVAKDLSAVYRADEDIEPVLIFGSAQPMMDAEVMPLKLDESDPGDNEVEWIEEPEPLVQVMIEDGVILEVGQETKVVVVVPGSLPYSLMVSSSDSSVLQVDDTGYIKALKPGILMLHVTVVVDDGSRVFDIEITSEVGGS